MMATLFPLQLALASLPEDAPEAVVSDKFVSKLLSYLGFMDTEIYPQYATSKDSQGKINQSAITDFAARKNTENDIFLDTKSNPNLLVEVKGRCINIGSTSKPYLAATAQLKAQLLGANCKSAQWGIITNGNHIQLFRKHGKVIFPATTCLELTLVHIDQVVGMIKNKIEHPHRALTVTIYNNKGGIGKTTTTVNLAAILSCLGKKVLIIDFDFNQQDLTTALGIKTTPGMVINALGNRDIDLHPAVETYSFPMGTSQINFDVIPADIQMINLDEVKLQQQSVNVDVLHKKLSFARNEYDYIFIDASPNWRLITQFAVYAADVVLIPTKHNNLFSLENAAITIKRFIPEIQEFKKDGTPIALPIFFNGEIISDSQLKRTQQEIKRIIQNDIYLLPYFFPRFTKANQNLTIHHVPNYADIASAHFTHVPAVYRNKSAREYYKSLAKEYFLQ